MRERNRWATRVPTRITLAHGLMALAGIVTFVSVSSVLDEQSETVVVAVARDEMTAGSVIRPADVANQFELIEVRADSPLLDGTVDPALIRDGQLIRSLGIGEPLRGSDLVPIAAGSIARTISIPVEDVVLTGLGLAVGDRIDVIGLGSQGSLEFVIVDAAIARLPNGSASSGAFAVRADGFVTIEVTESEALLLAAALRAGDVEIIRSTGADAAKGTS